MVFFFVRKLKDFMECKCNAAGNHAVSNNLITENNNNNCIYLLFLEQSFVRLSYLEAECNQCNFLNMCLSYLTFTILKLLIPVVKTFLKLRSSENFDDKFRFI